MIAQDAVDVVVFAREAGFAERRYRSAEDTLELPSLGISLPLVRDLPQYRAEIAEPASAMRKNITIGLVVPFANDEVPFEGPIMYPGVRFIPRGVGVRALTPEGYEPAWNAICRRPITSPNRASMRSWSSVPR